MKLVIEDEAGTRSIVPFRSDALVVGRGSEGVDWRLADRDVSRRHARFSRVNGAVWVEDLGSLTGTKVNGERLQGRRKLREGDLVEIGAYDLAVLADPAIAAATGPSTPPPIRTTPAPVPGAVAGAAAAATPARRTAPSLPAVAAFDPAASIPGAAPLDRAAPLDAERRARLVKTAIAAALSALLGLAAGYLAGWLGLV